MELNPDEQRAMDHLAAFLRVVQVEWELCANQGELSAAVHVLQGFVIQRMLHRLAPEAWSTWYREGLQK